MIVDPVTRRATLNADMFIALLTQGTEYREGRAPSLTLAANLLPPDARRYAQV